MPLGARRASVAGALVLLTGASALAATVLYSIPPIPREPIGAVGDAEGPASSCRYVVSTSESGKTLLVQGECSSDSRFRLRTFGGGGSVYDISPQFTQGRLRFDHRDLSGGDRQNGYRAPQRTWLVEPENGRVDFKYIFDVSALAEASSNNPDVAMSFGRSTVSRPAMWLVAPAHRGARIDIEFVSAGSRLTRIEPNLLSFDSGEVSFSPHVIAGSADVRPQLMDQTEYRHVILDEFNAQRWAEIETVSRRAVRGVADALGPSSVRKVQVLVHKQSFDRYARASLWAGGMASFLVSAASERALIEGHTLQLLRLASPFVGSEAWLREAIVTYASSLLDQRLSPRSPELFWLQLMMQMKLFGDAPGASTPRELWDAGFPWPAATPMVFLADIKMRSNSSGSLNVFACLKELAQRGGQIHAPMNASAVEDCDALAETSAWREIVRWDNLRRVDISAIWRELGVEHPDLTSAISRLFNGGEYDREAAGIRFNDGAPLAWVRRAMEEGR